MGSNTMICSNEAIYNVVVNEEDQYSIWPEADSLPIGWKSIGVSGQKEICLDYIEENWVDMRPKTLREKIARIDNKKKLLDQNHILLDSGSENSSLLNKLQNDQPVSVNLSEEKIEKFNTLKTVFVVFGVTKGETKIMMNLDHKVSRIASESNSIHLEGSLNLDLKKIRCVLDVDMGSYKGQGRIILVDN